MTKAKNNPKLKNAAPEDDGYPALAKILTTKIRAGYYAPGEKLEGVRTIAEEYGVGRRVADSALDLLVLKGLLRVEPRKGFYVSEKLVPNRNYKLAIYVAGFSPCVAGSQLTCALHEAIKHGYDLIYGSDYDEGPTLAKFMKRNPCVDGVLLAGDINDSIIGKTFKKTKKPYIAIGRHDIDKIHPQEDCDIEKLLAAELSKVLAPHKHKRIAVILGDSNSPSDKAIMRSVKKALHNIGAEIYPELLIHADGCGYSKTKQLFEKRVPDVVYTIGVFQLAVLRVLDENKAFKKPYLIGHEPIDLPDGTKDIFDEYLNLGDLDMAMTIKAVRRLVDMIEKGA